MKMSEYMEWIAKTRGLLTQLALELQVSPSYISAWRSGHQHVPQKYWRKIEKITGGYVTIGEILDEQVEWFDAQDRRSLSKKNEPKPRELPRLVGGNRP